jgi:hypothetical protein
MKCDDSRELLMEYSLDQLDPGRTIEVRDHLDKGCAVCAQRLSEIVETWASLAAGLEPVPPSPEVENRLLAMVRGEIAPPTLALDRSRSATSENSSRVLSLALAAALLGIATALVAWHFTPLGSTLANRVEAISPQTIWGSSSASESKTGFQTVSLNPITERQGVQLSVVMIEQAREWHVIATGLPTVDAGEKFQIWLETESGEFIKSSVIPIEKSGRGGVIIDMVDIGLTDLTGLWLTVESATDSVRPSDDILFRANIR